MKILASELKKLHGHAIAGYPFEVVGLLAGDAAAGRVTRVVPLLNERADSPRNRYVVSGLVVHRAEQALAEEGIALLGYYHSHPDHPARWSDYDRDHALPNMAYLIVAVRGADQPAPTVHETQVWRLLEDRSAMVALNFQEEE